MKISEQPLKLQRATADLYYRDRGAFHSEASPLQYPKIDCEMPCLNMLKPGKLEV